MRVIFCGIVEKGSGCNCAGRRSENVLVTRKTYHLPSGASKTFIAGHPVEVSDEDGAFLMQFTFKDKTGALSNVFKEA